MEKVIAPDKIVTDGVVLKELARQGIDKDYVEFWHDYAPRSKGEGYSPYVKVYRDLKSKKKIMVSSALPMVKVMGHKIEPKWLFAKEKYYSRANLFSAIVEGNQVQLTVLSDQPNGAKLGDQVIYKPQLFIDGIEIVSDSEPSLLPTDPVNENYQENTLEWTYGTVAQRRIRLIEGRYKDKFFILSHPNGRVNVKHNCTGKLSLKLGYACDAIGRPLRVTVIGNEEIIEASEFDNATFPVEIGATLTANPDADPTTNSCDGRLYTSARDLTWTNLIAVAEADTADDTSDFCGWGGFEASATTNQWEQLARSHTGFYTYIGAGAIVSAATLSLNGRFKNADIAISLNVYASSPGSNTELAVADYNNFGATAYCDTPIAVADWDDGDNYNDFVFNATGIAAINKTGVTNTGFREVTYDVTGNDPPWNTTFNPSINGYSADKGAGFKPKLVITYSSVMHQLWRVRIGGVTYGVRLIDISDQTVVGNVNLERLSTGSLVWVAGSGNIAATTLDLDTEMATAGSSVSPNAVGVILSAEIWDDTSWPTLRLRRSSAETADAQITYVQVQVTSTWINWQGIIPITGDNTFEYTLTGATNASLNIKLVGWITLE